MRDINGFKGSVGCQGVEEGRVCGPIIWMFCIGPHLPPSFGVQPCVGASPSAIKIKIALFCALVCLQMCYQSASRCDWECMSQQGE